METLRGYDEWKTTEPDEIPDGSLCPECGEYEYVDYLMDEGICRKCSKKAQKARAFVKLKKSSKVSIESFPF